MNKFSYNDNHDVVDDDDDDDGNRREIIVFRCPSIRQIIGTLLQDATAAESRPSEDSSKTTLTSFLHLQKSV